MPAGGSDQHRKAAITDEPHALSIMRCANFRTTAFDARWTASLAELDLRQAARGGFVQECSMAIPLGMSYGLRIAMLVRQHFDEPPIYGSAARERQARLRRHAFEQHNSWNRTKT
jgi:hypothetical protein